MKKSILFISFILVTAVLASCAKNSSSAAPEPVLLPVDNSAIDTFQEKNAVYAEYGDYFKMEGSYAPRTPEAKSEARKIATGGQSSKGGSTKSEVKNRELSSFKTKYNTKRVSFKDFIAAILGKEAGSDPSDAYEIEKILLNEQREYENDKTIIMSVVPGISRTQTVLPDSDGLEPERAKNLMVTSKVPLTMEEFHKAFFAGTSESMGALKYSVDADFEKETGKAEIFYVTLENTPVENSRIFYKNLLNLNNENSYSEVKSYWTLRNFKVERTSRIVSNANPSRKNAVYVDFNQIPDERTLDGNISIAYKCDSEGNVNPAAREFKVEVKPENYTLYRKRLYIYNIDYPFYESRYTINLDSSNIKDIYGQELITPDGTETFLTPSASSYFKLCDNGNKILEAQFPHRLAYAYQNLLEGSWTRLAKAENPLYYTWGNPVKDDSSVDLDLSHFDQRVMDYVELDDLLDNGKGWISFEALYSYKDHDWLGNPVIKKREQCLKVQVTDLGVTARIGINRAVALVRSLETNKPVADAEVELYLNSTEENSRYYNTNSIAKGKTNKNGLAVIEIPEKQATKMEHTSNTIALLVSKDGDKVTFEPCDHNWRSDFDEARRVYPRVFLFSDRKLYKPGETVSFRGIHKNQFMNNYSSYHGKYKIKLEAVRWDDSNIYWQTVGKTSESGGFFGTFELPENIKPASYRLSYYMPTADGDEWECTGWHYIDVRFFEQTKLQTEANIPDVTYISGSKINVSVKGSYLAGGVIAGGSIENTWYSQPDHFESTLPEAKNLVFGPEYTNDYRRYLSEDTGTLDAGGTGTATITANQITDGAPRSYILESEITDVSNEKTSFRSSILVHPAKFYIGLGIPYAKGFPEKGRKIDFEYLLVTPDNKIAGTTLVNGELNYSVKRITWELSNANGIDDEIYTRYHKVENEVASGSFKPESKGSFAYTPEKSGEYVVAITGKDNKGNIARTEYNFYSTGSDAWFSPDSDGAIDIVPDQSMYNPGDTAKVLLKSSLPAGDYLITVEREGIFTQELRHFDSPSNIIEVPVSEKFLPYAYVCVASYSTRTKEPAHQFGEKDMDKPKGYFGMAKIHVNPYVRAFSIDVKTDKTIYRPGDTATITLTATKGGKALPDAELTVMGVDRAVIDLINYHVPNPIDFFYDEWNFKHCVRGGDNRNMLMDPVTYAIKNLQGGDADESKEEQRRDFKPTAFFEPSVKTDNNGVATVTFKVPSQLTTFRVTAFGVRGEQFAVQEDEFGVRNPVNVTAIQPRRLRVRDTAECGVVLTNLSEKKVDVTVSLEIRTPETDSDEDTQAGLVTVPGKAFVDDAEEKTVTVGSGDSTTITYFVGAQKEGNIELVYHIKSDVLNEALYSPVKIEKTYTYDTIVWNGCTSEDEKAGAEEKIVIPGFAEDGAGSLEVMLDATQLGLLKPAVNYLFDYPYGCFEQRTSRVLPLLIFGDYIKTFNLDSKVRNPKSVVKSHFKYIADYQKQDGGFGYWQQSSESDFYVSLRILELYYRALDKGFTQTELKINGTALKNYVDNYLFYHAADSDCWDKAYALYVQNFYAGKNINTDSEFAMAKDKSFGGMTLLALANVKSDPEKAGKIAKDLSKYIQQNQRSISLIKFNQRNEDLAYYLKLLVLLDKDNPLINKVLFTILTNGNHGYWDSTRGTAAVLDAVEVYIKANNLDLTKFNALCELNGIKLAEGNFKGAGAVPVTNKYAFSSEQLKSVSKDKVLPLKFNKEGTGKLFYTATMQFALPDELQNYRDHGINVKYEIIDSETDTIMNKDSNNRILNLEKGKTYSAKITISTGKNRSYLALRAPVPSGAAILDAHFVNVSSKAEMKKDSDYRYWWNNKRRMTSEALYDNEGQFFWDYFTAGKYELEFQFRANRAGVYPCPPVQAECMYEPEVSGRSDGYLFVIK